MNKARALPKSVLERPTPEQIMVLAYHHYLKNGCPDGNGLDEWLEAERILNEQAVERKKLAALSAPQVPPLACLVWRNQGLSRILY